MLVGLLVRALVFSTLPPWRFRSACLLNGGLASLIIAPLLDQFLHQIPPTDTVSYPGPGELLLLVFSLSLGLCALRRAVMSEHLQQPAPITPAAIAPAPPPAPETAVQPNAPPLPRLLQRLDAEDHGSLWSISVRDHYVDVQTSRGVTSLLMRLSDAMAETAPVEGRANPPLALGRLGGGAGCGARWRQVVRGVAKRQSFAGVEKSPGKAGRAGSAVTASARHW